MLVKIFQASETLFRDSCDYRRGGRFFNQAKAIAAVATRETTGAYKFAGAIDCPVGDRNAVLEHAYSRSQNGEIAWNLTTPCRSTSVGDILMIDEDAYIVASFGFDKLDGNDTAED